MTPCRTDAPLVSAIISTYNAKRFIRGKLEDLEAQTIAQELEIIVIDSGSRENEGAIVEEFRARYANIRYIRTEERETVYQAWNRGIKLARGEFVCNANTDDRLRRDCYETLVRALRQHPQCVLAYPDMRITRQENTTFDNHTPYGFRQWPDFTRISLLELCCVGPFPLWRRSLHDEMGYFDERFRSAADYEFWLRAALKHEFLHVPEFLGLYWLNEETVSRKGDLPTLEYLEIQKEYRPLFAPLTPPAATLSPAEEEQYQALISRAGNCPGGIVELQRFAERHPNWPRAQHDLGDLFLKNSETGLAKKHFEKAAILDPMSPLYGEKLQAFLRIELYQSLKYYTAQAAASPGDPETQLTAGMISLLLERFDTAREHYLHALEIEPGSDLARENLAYLDRLSASPDAQPPFDPAVTDQCRILWERGARDEALALAERDFALSPLNMNALDRFHRYATALDAAAGVASPGPLSSPAPSPLQREEQRVREALATYPEHQGLAYGLIENLIRQRRYGDAIEEIGRSAVIFGLDDGTIDAALEIRALADMPVAATSGAASVTLCMIVKDEAKHLPTALLSVKGLADEIIVVDTGSSDRSADIARIFGANTFSFPWNGSFSDARNFSISKATGAWIMVLDADEVLAPRDLPPLAALLKRTTSPTAYSFTTRNYINEVTRKNWTANRGEYPGEERGRGWTPSEKVRLFPNDNRIEFRGAVHELLEESLIECGIPIHGCDIPVHHYGRLDAAKTAVKQKEYYLLGLRKMEETGESVESLTELAIQATELQRFQEAEGLWHRVLQARPESIDAHFNLGYLHLVTGDFPRARSHALRAVELAPEVKEAAFNLAKCDLYMGNIAEALSRCQKLLAVCPDYPPVMSLLSVILLLIGRRADARSLIGKLRGMHYDCPDFLREYAEGLRQGARPDLSAPLLALATTLETAEASAQASQEGEIYCHA